jgi:hypothetical protein
MRHPHHARYAAMHSYLTERRHRDPAEADRIFPGIAANAKVTKGHTVQGGLLSAGQFAIASSVYSHKAAAGARPTTTCCGEPPKPADPFPHRKDGQ